MSSKERICVACRELGNKGPCPKHDNPIHGLTEAECALQVAQLGFDIVEKGDKDPVTVEELRRAVRGQKIDKNGYVTYPKREVTTAKTSEGTLTNRGTGKC